MAAMQAKATPRAASSARVARTDRHAHARCRAASPSACNRATCREVISALLPAFERPKTCLGLVPHAAATCRPYAAARLCLGAVGWQRQGDDSGEDVGEERDSQAVAVLDLPKPTSAANLRVSSDCSLGGSYEKKKGACSFSTFLLCSDFKAKVDTLYCVNMRIFPSFRLHITRAPITRVCARDHMHLTSLVCQQRAYVHCVPQHAHRVMHVPHRSAGRGQLRWPQRRRATRLPRQPSNVQPVRPQATQERKRRLRPIAVTVPARRQTDRWRLRAGSG